MGKRAYLYEELGEGTVELMKTIKNAVDPLNLFNPGKVSRIFLCPGCKTAYSLAIPAIPGEARQIGARSLRGIFEEIGTHLCSIGLHE